MKLLKKEICIANNTGASISLWNLYGTDPYKGLEIEYVMPDLPQCAYNLQSGSILVELNGKLKVMWSI